MPVPRACTREAWTWESVRCACPSRPPRSRRFGAARRESARRCSRQATWTYLARLLVTAQYEPTRWNPARNRAAQERFDSAAGSASSTRTGASTFRRRQSEEDHPCQHREYERKQKAQAIMPAEEARRYDVEQDHHRQGRWVVARNRTWYSRSFLCTPSRTGRRRHDTQHHERIQQAEQQPSVIPSAE